ncbi:hypothetical protein FOL47_009151 [Perkinsus chesapeaki]|uniref:GLTSCR protein conserved domain-containing protein n=1 Tax=Perkinsus chesapeaki TaxID=330153 RepID=A0A7J6MS82_PERCH|nr:hypothetical protein FOL47_009151 [Perkinsus chesapeaki]
MAGLDGPGIDVTTGLAETDELVVKDDDLAANPGALWAELSSFERQMARTRKDILNSTTSVTSTDLRECIHNARADWPAAMEPFKDVNDALERLLPYHACYEQDSAEDSTAQLDKVLATVESRVSGVRNETKLCREATARDTPKRKFNVVKSIEFEELSHKSGRLRQEIDRIERDIQLQRAAAKLQAAKAEEAAQAAEAATTNEEKVKTEENQGK